MSLSLVCRNTVKCNFNISQHIKLEIVFYSEPIQCAQSYTQTTTCVSHFYYKNKVSAVICRILVTRSTEQIQCTVHVGAVCLELVLTVRLFIIRCRARSCQDPGKMLYSCGLESYLHPTRQPALSRLTKLNWTRSRYLWPQVQRRRSRKKDGGQLVASVSGSPFCCCK